jgi:NADH:ubiquinone oxidoreductase subunit 6 (subunit J)
MTAVFIILSLFTVGTAIAAMTLRNLVHCALSLALTFAGLAALYLQLNAQFVGFAQILVYVGAVAILIVFAILLTRGTEPPTEAIFSNKGFIGVAVAAVVFAVIAAAVLSSRALPSQSASAASASVRQIGDQLMTRYIMPLEVLGLLLTAALIGAVILALHETSNEQSGGAK